MNYKKAEPSFMNSYDDYQPKCACGKKAVRLAWRWNDPKRMYQSGRKLIHTGYTFICINCIKIKLK